MDPTAASTAKVGAGRSYLTGLQRSVLLTVLYADLFDYPLTEDELRMRLIRRHAGRAAIRRCVGSLSNRYLARSGPYVTWKGREHIVDLRRRREAASEELWRAAERYAAWLARVPFIRMVAVSGSLAAGNADERSDVDVFCITESNRLWMARLFIVPLSKMTRLFPRLFSRYLCPNYILARGALAISDRNLFTAHEIIQAVPIYGAPAYREFLRANTWVDAYLPLRSPPSVPSETPSPPLVTRMIERALAGRVGDALDLAVHRLFRAFYRRRALRRGWPWQRLEGAYGRSRYTVPEGGYIPVVRHLFLRRLRDRLGPPDAESDVDHLFPQEYDQTEEGCYEWESLFRRDYGDVHERPHTAEPLTS